jgi:hypothetical protein
MTNETNNYTYSSSSTTGQNTNNLYDAKTFEEACEYWATVGGYDGTYAFPLNRTWSTDPKDVYVSTATNSSSSTSTTSTTTSTGTQREAEEEETNKIFCPCFFERTPSGGIFQNVFASSQSSSSNDGDEQNSKNGSWICRGYQGKGGGFQFQSSGLLIGLMIFFCFAMTWRLWRVKIRARAQEQRAAEDLNESVRSENNLRFLKEDEQYKTWNSCVQPDGSKVICVELINAGAATPKAKKSSSDGDNDDDDDKNDDYLNVGDIENGGVFPPRTTREDEEEQTTGRWRRNNSNIVLSNY